MHFREKMIRFSIFFLALLILSCDVSTPEEAGQAALENALDELELAFNLHHIDEIMVYYSPDYLHNGDDKDDVQLDWEIRLNDYQEMVLDDIVIELNDDRATISFIRRFYDNGQMVKVLVDPDDNGDMSYWKQEFDEWKIVGNRENGW